MKNQQDVTNLLKYLADPAFSADTSLQLIKLLF